MSVNLIICGTPLQMLIAEKIIDLYPNEKFFLATYSIQDINDKYYYYFNRLKQKCSEGGIIFKRTNLWSQLYPLVRIAIASNGRINKLFFSNLIDDFVASCFKRLYIDEVYTFDDGTLSLELFKDHLNEFKPLPTQKKGIPVLCKIGPYSHYEIRASIRKHFTIYPDLFPKSTFFIPLKLIESQDLNIDTSLPVKTIFLGQPIFQYEGQRSKEYLERIIERLNVDYYFPHPRDNYSIESKAEQINTELIFEDYIFHKAKQHPCRIYTLFSTVALNLRNIPGVEVIVIKPKPFPLEEVPLVYETFERIGIPIEEIELE